MFKYFLLISAVLLSLIPKAQNKEGFDQMVSSNIDFLVDTISPALLQNTSALFIDTRTKEEYAVSKIANSIFIDYNSFDINSFKNIHKNDSVIVYCSIGVRSEKVGVLLLEAGFTKVFNLYGGLFSWSNQQFPIVDAQLKSTNKIHGYNKEWSIWINATPSEVILGVRQWSDVSANMWNTMTGTFNWAWKEITFQSDPWYINYCLWLLIASGIVFGLEILFPWRKNQAILRKDFWMDFIYMFLNFFVFTIFLQVLFALFWELAQISGFHNDSFSFLDLSALPIAAQLLLFFIINDFVQWFTHWSLHRVPLFWNFHKVHHSVKEMGFAAHLRYHWMENVLYKPLKTLVVMIIVGVQEPEYAFIIHYFTILIGHLNHSNINVDYKWLKYIFNNPKMHIWHHVKELPNNRPKGMNYGISLSVWDYIFGTAHIPSDGRDIEIGFNNDQNFPKTIIGQSLYPLNKRD